MASSSSSSWTNDPYKEFELYLEKAHVSLFFFYLKLKTNNNWFWLCHQLRDDQKRIRHFWNVSLRKKKTRERGRPWTESKLFPVDIYFKFWRYPVHTKQQLRICVCVCVCDWNNNEPAGRVRMCNKSGCAINSQGFILSRVCGGPLNLKRNLNVSRLKQIISSSFFNTLIYYIYM